MILIIFEFNIYEIGFNYFILLQDKNLSSGTFFLELLSAVEPRVVNWSLVTKGETGMLPFGVEIEASQTSDCTSLVLC